MKQDFKLRIGVQCPNVERTAGGAFELQSTIFTEILSFHNLDFSDLNFEFVPVSDSVNILHSWGLSPSNSILLPQPISSPPPSIQKRLINSLLTRLGIPVKPSSYASYISKRDEILNSSIDILWALDYQPMSLAIPFILSVWDLQHRIQPFFPETRSSWAYRENLYASILPRALLCLTGTHRGKKEIIHFYGVDENSVLINPFPCPKPLKPSDDSAQDLLARLRIEKQKYILYPAQFWPHKNHVAALYAVRILLDHGATLKLVLPGSDKGSMQYIKELVSHLDLVDQVIIPGFIERDELASLYRNAFALIFPSFFGPDNIPPLEAMSYCIPALVASVQGSWDQYGDSVLYFNPNEPCEIANHILWLLSNPSKREELVKAGAQHVASLTANNYISTVLTALSNMQFAMRCMTIPIDQY